MKTETPAAGEAAGAVAVVQGEQKTTAPPALFQPPGTMLECARRYAALNLHIFPIWPLLGSKCSCRRPDCSSPGKHPRIRWKAGASCDPATVEGYWRRWPNAGIGCATGPSRLLVADADGPRGVGELSGICGPMPQTARSRTARGVHVFFRGEGGTRSNPERQLDTRGVGGFVVLPPSPHVSGHVYRWDVPPEAGIAECPAPLLAYANEKRGRREDGRLPGVSLAPLTAACGSAGDLTTRLGASLDAPDWGEVDCALACIPAVERDIWIKVGMALHATMHPQAFERWDKWSQTCPEKYKGDTDYVWSTFKPGAIGIGTLFDLAIKHGYQRRWVMPHAPDAPPTSPAELGDDVSAGSLVSEGEGPTGKKQEPSLALPTNAERTSHGALKPKSYVNTSLALAALGIAFRHDVFHNKKIVEGEIEENISGELSDAICRALRDLIIARFHFDPGKENVQEAAERACEINRFDPVCDYLDGLQWDGQQRLDIWVIKYLGAEDTPLNRAFGRKMLIAAVRRVRQPGCKFDYVPVLEGKTRTGKSTALKILAGEKNFSDQPILHLDTRAQQEQIAGVWIYELSELAGMKRTDVETLKNFLSKTEDNARPAYGRFRTDQQRRGIFVGTTNDDQYLRDPTGNARYWPVRTGIIDLETLRRDRDQLWAEAALAEKQDESLVIPENLYEAATVEQGKRLMQDPWEILLEDLKGEVTQSATGDDIERIATQHILMQAGIDRDLRGEPGLRRLRVVMNRLGWQGPKKLKFSVSQPGRANGVTKSDARQGYWRVVSPVAGGDDDV
jgi:hypothetical protein